jgi:hypothetical protein
MVCEQIKLSYIFLIVFQLLLEFAHSIISSRQALGQSNAGVHQDLLHIRPTSYDLFLVH